MVPTLVEIPNFFCIMMNYEGVGMAHEILLLKKTASIYPDDDDDGAVSKMLLRNLHQFGVCTLWLPFVKKSSISIL